MRDTQEVEIDPTVEADFIRRITEAIAAIAADDKAGRLHKAGESFLCTTPQGWQFRVRLGRYVMVSGEGKFCPWWITNSRMRRAHLVQVFAFTDIRSR